MRRYTFAVWMRKYPFMEKTVPVSSGMCQYQEIKQPNMNPM